MGIDETLAWLGQDFKGYLFFGRTCICETSNVITVKELVKLAKEDLMHKCVKCDNEIESQLRYHNEERPLGWYPLNEDEYNECNFNNTKEFLPLTGEENKTLEHLRDINILDEATYKESLSKLKQKLKDDNKEKETVPETGKLKKENKDIEDAESSSIDKPGQIEFMYTSSDWASGVLNFERGKHLKGSHRHQKYCKNDLLHEV